MSDARRHYLGMLPRISMLLQVISISFLEGSLPPETLIAF